MNEPVSFKTPSGDDMIILPRSEYEALTEYADMLDRHRCLMTLSRNDYPKAKKSLFRPNS